jgi:hypothetical protein
MADDRREILPYVKIERKDRIIDILGCIAAQNI